MLIKYGSDVNGKVAQKQGFLERVLKALWGRATLPARPAISFNPVSGSAMHRLLLLPALYLLPVIPVMAAEPDPLFASSEPLAITLTGPFDQIDDDRDRDTEYEGTLSYLDDSGSEVVLDASFEVRGNWRLNPRNCDYSQLWVDLRRGQLPGTVFENQNRLKLVVQCRRQDRYADYIHQERQLYRMFALLSDYHFDTRALQVTYVDSEDPDSVRNHAGFFIEHQNRLSDRFGMAEVEESQVDRAFLNPVQGTLVSLFMFMIGNTDFSLIQGPEGEECCHNGKLLVSSDGEFFPIPYDFDASGFIDASYAPEPNPAFRLRSIRSRLYRGFCVEQAAMAEAVAKFQAVREEFFAIVGEDPDVNSRTTRNNVGYLEDFYEILDDQRDFEDDILDECRG